MTGELINARNSADSSKISKMSRQLSPTERVMSWDSARDISA
ncbi:hypothetical protein CY0110_17922 [Crocosphaera chwakensis CCY0110]|uniref:Uncharacterized protein n=1 Tax=Crocosphaera chwakensis CCY0110 TaxID=391612 RepID=A3IIR6_9CHRO|nr:hypothetical protein CY0110_17922 [Crocosphaera chwakensis CCY0110]